ncbi:MAG: MurR/RpiR family transcriptional regulator [Actinomycetota bacterium]|nr:MurR/RpiR family transcriptional regulator [Actinomycetota bacterium]
MSGASGEAPVGGRGVLSPAEALPAALGAAAPAGTGGTALPLAAVAGVSRLDGVLAHLESLLPSLAPSEQRVGRVILSLPGSAAHLTITELAGMAETSETTVVRFVRSLGLGSYPELRIALAQAAGRATVRPEAYMSPDISPDDDLATVVAKVGAADAQAVASTVANLDAGALERVVEAVEAARRIDIYGVAASAIVAADLQQKLHRIGLAAFAWSDLHLALSSAANLLPGDVAIAISHGGTTVDTVEALGQARRAGATTVAITNFPKSPISTVADVLVRTTVSETAFRAGAMASRIAELVVVDCLFTAVAERRYAETVAALARTREAVRNRHRGRRR